MSQIVNHVKGIRFAEWRGEERTRTLEDGRVVTRDVFKPVDEPSHEGLAQWERKGMKFWLMKQEDAPKALWLLAESEAFVKCVNHLVEMDQSLVLDVGTVGAQLRIEGGKAVEVLSTRQTIGKVKTPYEMRHNPYQCLEDSLKGLEMRAGVGDGWIRVFFVWWR